MASPTRPFTAWPSNRLWTRIRVEQGARREDRGGHAVKGQCSDVSAGERARQCTASSTMRSQAVPSRDAARQRRSKLTSTGAATPNGLSLPVPRPAACGILLFLENDMDSRASWRSPSSSSLLVPWAGSPAAASAARGRTQAARAPAARVQAAAAQDRAVRVGPEAEAAPVRAAPGAAPMPVPPTPCQKPAPP